MVCAHFACKSSAAVLLSHRNIARIQDFSVLYTIITTQKVGKIWLASLRLQQRNDTPGISWLKTKPTIVCAAAVEIGEWCHGRKQLDNRHFKTFIFQRDNGQPKCHWKSFKCHDAPSFNAQQCLDAHHKTARRVRKIVKGEELVMDTKVGTLMSFRLAMIASYNIRYFFQIEKGMKDGAKKWFSSMSTTFG